MGTGLHLIFLGIYQYLQYFFKIQLKNKKSLNAQPLTEKKN